MTNMKTDKEKKKLQNMKNMKYFYNDFFSSFKYKNFLNQAIKNK